jgi:hypothetical protein
MTQSTLSIVTLSVRFVLAGMFLYAGVSKTLTRSTSLIELLRRVGIHNETICMSIVRLLPASEILLGLWMFTDRGVSLALITSAVVLTIFAAVIVIAVYKGYEGNCGCFGSSGNRPIGVESIILDICLTVLSLWASYLCRSDIVRTKAIWAITAPEGMVLVLVVALVGAACILRTEVALLTSAPGYNRR